MSHQSCELVTFTTSPEFFHHVDELVRHGETSMWEGRCERMVWIAVACSQVLNEMLDSIQSAPQERILQRIDEQISDVPVYQVESLGVLGLVPQERGTGCVAEEVVDVPAHKIIERS